MNCFHSDVNLIYNSQNIYIYSSSIYIVNIYYALTLKEGLY